MGISRFLKWPLLCSVKQLKETYEKSIKSLPYGHRLSGLVHFGCCKWRHPPCMLCVYRCGAAVGVRWSFVPFAFSFFAYTLHWWTDTEGSLAAAVEEMPAGYNELMKPVIDNLPMLIVVMALTIPIAILAMRLAERAMKKQAATLN